MSDYAITQDQQDELDNIFSYHRPFGDQPARYEAIRAKGRELAQLILEKTPRSPDQSAALRKVREAIFTANAAIAINEVDPSPALPAPDADKAAVPFVRQVLVMNQDLYGHLESAEIWQIVNHAEKLAKDVKADLAESLRRAEFGVKAPFASLWNAIVTKFPALSSRETAIGAAPEAAAPQPDAPSPAVEGAPAHATPSNESQVKSEVAPPPASPA